LEQQDARDRAGGEAEGRYLKEETFRCKGGEDTERILLQGSVRHPFSSSDTKIQETTVAGRADFYYIWTPMFKLVMKRRFS
jgi:hypothetical protein